MAHHRSTIVRPSSIAPTRVFISPIPTANVARKGNNQPVQKRFCYQRSDASTITSTDEEPDDDDDDDDDAVTTTGAFSTLTQSTVTTSPPASPPLSPSPSLRTSRLPRWIRHIGSISSIMTPTALPPCYDEVEHHNAALYYEAPEVRQYLQQVTVRSRFDQMLLEGFPTIDGEGARTMTLRLTLTPAHCRATDKEIYGKPSVSCPSSSHRSSLSAHPQSLPPVAAPNTGMAFPKRSKSTSAASMPPLFVPLAHPAHPPMQILHQHQHQHHHRLKHHPSPRVLILPPRKR